MYDVAVVGAGPAGATAGYYLAKAGHSVCLIDKDTFPRDKPCGGGFATTLVDEFSYLKKRSKEFIQATCQTGVLHSPNQRIVLMGRADMAVALRTEFDHVLYEIAVDSGAEPLIDHRIKRIAFNTNGVVLEATNGRVVEASAVVGADGVNSLVARSTGLNPRWPSSKVTACRVLEIPVSEKEITDIYTEDRQYHFFANLGGHPGYGWSFPKTRTVNVGLGIVGKHSKGLPGRFTLFLRHLKREGLLPHNASTSHAKGALVPTGGPLGRTVRDRCVLVGDSAGMVNPLTGGGILYAMKSGRFAASVVSSCLEKNTLSALDLLTYQRLWMKDFGGEFRSQLLAQKIFTGPFADTLFAIGSHDESIQERVSSMMSEGAPQRSDVLGLLCRFLYVCLREAIF
ncbi:MAG: geranylgeranyl reductase family protein [Candidatus Thorarchaeota archaeon]|nr:geranylgeranyl reductase family protein [Candidatus Thorarchaeota archaeon]